MEKCPARVLLDIENNQIMPFIWDRKKTGFIPDPFLFVGLRFRAIQNEYEHASGLCQLVGGKI
ncbi:MAG: hypothetical protein KAR12_17015, partial [Methylococcales bacterium]|nr:hypothetical protein [Methylococcales bacterium]